LRDRNDHRRQAAHDPIFAPLALFSQMRAWRLAGPLFSLESKPVHDTAALATRSMRRHGALRSHLARAGQDSLDGQIQPGNAIPVSGVHRSPTHFSL
jgi:hypothetical protein